MARVHFNVGDRITISPLSPHMRKQAPAASHKMYRHVVIAKDEGRAGGWDVYDGVDDDGNEESFYGFQVVQVRRADKRGRATNRVHTGKLRFQGAHTTRRVAEEFARSLRAEGHKGVRVTKKRDRHIPGRSYNYLVWVR